MKRFNDYTDAELLGLDNDTLNDSIRVEAIERGIQPPITLSDALRQSEWKGYQRPGEAVTVYEIVLSGKYENSVPTRVAYMDRNLAERALEGVFMVDEDGYGAKAVTKIYSGEPKIQERKIGVSKSVQSWAKLQEFTQDSVEFDAVMEECIERLSKARQDDYNRRVNQEKRTEYLRLAGGDEAIAKSFWAKVERSEWPEALVQP